LVVGASAGIGRATAVRLAELGYRVAVVGRRKDRLDDVVAQMGDGHSVSGDLSESAQCEGVVEEAVAGLGGIDLLVYAASASRLSRLADVDADMWTSVLQTNLVAPALVVRASLPHLAPGAIVCLMSSEAVGNPHEGLVPYAVSKAALEELVRGLRNEHPDLRFCCLRVGATEGTEFARDFSPELGAELFPRWIATGRMPAQMMQVAELGNAIADTLAVAAGSPGVDLQDLVIRAPGGTYRGDSGFMLDKVEEASEAAQ
jgi:NAD(P)-dependent dehydrogenase (short-subunit alcohol dehydrogenase family)